MKGTFGQRRPGRCSGESSDRRGRITQGMVRRPVRPRPGIGVTLIGHTASRLRNALLAAGAEDTLVPEQLACLIGVDLSDAPVLIGSGIGMGQVPVRYAQIRLRITDGREQREW